MEDPRLRLKKFVNDNNYPESFSLRNTRAATPVRNQRNFPICAALVVSDLVTMKFRYDYEHLKDLMLSSQPLIDLVPNYTNPDDCFNYVKDHGLYSSTKYPRKYGRKPDERQPQVPLKRYRITQVERHTNPDTLHEFIVKCLFERKTPVMVGYIPSVASALWREGRPPFRGGQMTGEPGHVVIATGYSVTSENPLFHKIEVKDSNGPEIGYEGYKDASPYTFIFAICPTIAPLP